MWRNDVTTLARAECVRPGSGTWRCRVVLQIADTRRGARSPGIGCELCQGQGAVEVESKP